MNPSIVKTEKHLTQKELGMAVGFPDSCADVRIAQYESDIRTPKRRSYETLRINTRRSG